MIELIKKIASSKKDVVFVGSTSLYYIDKTISPKDIDIVVNSLDGLDIFGDIKTWETKSPMSLSGQRAHIKRDDFDIDIFIEPTLPKYNIIDDIKFLTIEAFGSYLDLLVESTEGELKNMMIEKKRRLSSLI